MHRAETVFIQIRVDCCSVETQVVLHRDIETSCAHKECGGQHSGAVVGTVEKQKDLGLNPRVVPGCAPALTL